MASGADQKNPSGNRGNNQPQRNEFAESIIGRVLRQIEAANERGNTDNQALYEKILRGYDVMTNDQKAQLEELDRRHGNVAEALATMSGDTVANMQGLIDGTKTNVLTEAKARTDEVGDKFDAATSKLGELAQQAEGRVDAKGAEAAGRVQDLAAGAKQEVADLGQQTADDVAGRGAAAREGMTGRMDKSIRDLINKYRSAEFDAARTVRGGRDAIAGQYDALRGTDAAARQQAAEGVRGDFAAQEGAAAGRFGAARGGAGTEFDKARGEIGSDYQQALSAAQQRMAAGREQVQQGFGAAQQQAAGLTDDAAARAAGITQAAQQQAGGIVSQAQQQAGQLGTAAQQQAGQIASAAQDRAGQIAQAGQQQAGQIMQGLGDRAGQYFASAQDRAAQLAQQSAGRSGQIGQSALQDLAGRAEGRLQDLSGQFTQFGQDARQQGRELGADLQGRFDAAGGKIGGMYDAAIGDTAAGFAAGRGRVEGGYDAAQSERAGRYDARTQTGLNMFDKMGQESFDRINRQFDDSLARRTAALNQSLASRGLANTTVAQTMLNDLQSESDQNRQQAIAQVEGQVRQQKAAAYERFTAQGMSAQDAMQASGLAASTNLTGAEMQGQQQMRGAKAGAAERMAGQGVQAYGQAAQAGNQAGLQAGLQGLAQRAAGQRDLMGAEQAVGRQVLQGQLGAEQAGTAAQMNLLGQGAGTQAGLTQAEAQARLGMAQQGVGQQINLAGQAAGQQMGLVGQTTGQQMNLLGQGAGQQMNLASQGAGQQIGLIGQGVNQQIGLAGQGAGAGANITGQGLSALNQMAQAGASQRANISGQRAAGQQGLLGQQAAAQQQAGMAGAAAGQQMAGQNLAAGTALGQAGLAARERGQAALEGQTQQARLAGLAALASGQQQQRGADAALTGQQFGAEAQALGQGQQGVTSLAGQALGARANLEGQRFGQGAALAGQGLGLQGANVGQGLSAFDRARQQESSIAAQLAGQGMAAQTGQMAQGFGTQAQLSQGQLAGLERKQAEENMIKQRTLDFMGDTTIESPGWDAAANLALAAGQAGMGVGGGQGGMNPAMEAAMNQLAAQQRWMQGNVAANQQRAAQQQAANQAFQERLMDKQQEERREVRLQENEMALNRRKWEAEDAKFRQDWQRELNERDDAKFSGQMSQANKVREEQLKILEEAAKKLEDHTADWQSKYENALKEGNIALADEIRAGAEKEAAALKTGYDSAKNAYQSTNDTLAQALEASASQRNQGLETINVDVTVDGDKVTITDKESGVEVIDGTGAASQGPEGGYPGGGPFYPPNQSPGGMGNEGGNTNQPGGGTTNQPGGGTTNQPGGGTTNQPGGGTTNQPGGAEGTPGQPGPPGQPGGGTTNQPGQPGGGKPTPPPGVPPGSVYVEPGTNPGLPGGGWVGGGKIYTPEGQVMTKPMPNPPPVPTTPAGGGNQGGGGQPTGIPPWMLPGGEQPGGEQPGGEQPGGEQPGGGQPGGEQPGGGQPTGIPPWMLPTEGGEQPGGGGPVLTPPDVANMPWQMQPERMPWRNWGEYTQFMQEQLDPGGEQAALAAQMDDGMGGGFSGGGFGGGSAGGSLQGLAAQAQGTPQRMGMSVMPPPQGEHVGPNERPSSGGQSAIMQDGNGRWVDRATGMPVEVSAALPQQFANRAADGGKAAGGQDAGGGQAAGGQPAQGNQLEAPRTDMNPAKYQAMMQGMIQPGMEMAGDIWNEQLQKQGEIVEQANEQSRRGQGIASGFPVPPPDVSFAAPQGGGALPEGYTEASRRAGVTPEQFLANKAASQSNMDRLRAESDARELDRFRGQQEKFMSGDMDLGQYREAQRRAEERGYAPDRGNQADREAQWMAQFRERMGGDFADQFTGPDALSQAQKFDAFGRNRFQSRTSGASRWSADPQTRRQAMDEWRQSTGQSQQPQMQPPQESLRQPQQQPSLQNLSEQAQGADAGQGPTQETPLWQQKMTPDMTTRQKNQIANARYRHYKPTMPVGRDGLNKVEANARIREQNAAMRNPTTVNAGNPNQGQQPKQLSNRDRRLMNYTPPAKGRWNRQADSTRFNQLQGMNPKPSLKNVSNMAKPRMSLQQMYRN